MIRRNREQRERKGMWGNGMKGERAMEGREEGRRAVEGRKEGRRAVEGRGGRTEGGEKGKVNGGI